MNKQVNKQDENVVSAIDEIDEETTNVKAIIISIFVILLTLSCLCVYLLKFRTMNINSEDSYDIELGELPSDNEQFKFNFFTSAPIEENERDLLEGKVNNQSTVEPVIEETQSSESLDENEMTVQLD